MSLHPVEAPVFRAAFARGGDWVRATAACVGQLQPAPARANFGFLYLGRALSAFADAILARLRAATGVHEWVGAAGERALGSGYGDSGEGGMAVLLAALPARGFRVLAPGYCGAGRGHSAAILHAEAGGVELGLALDQLAASTEAFLVGVTSPARVGLPQIAGGVAEGPPSGVLLGSTVALLPLVAGGGLPIGRPARVTSRVGDELYALDGRPALELVFARLGDLARMRPERALGDLLVGSAGPEGTPSRPLAGVARFDLTRGSLTLDSAAALGPNVVLFRQDPQTAERQLRAALEGAFARLGGRRARAVLYFTAKRRLDRLAAAGVDEVAILHEGLGRPPLVGLAGEAVIVEARVEPFAAVAAVFA